MRFRAPGAIRGALFVSGEPGARVSLSPQPHPDQKRLTNAGLAGIPISSRLRSAERVFPFLSSRAADLPSGALLSFEGDDNGQESEEGETRQVPRRQAREQAPGEDQGTGALVMGLGLTAEWGGPEAVFALLICAALLAVMLVAIALRYARKSGALCHWLGHRWEEDTTFPGCNRFQVERHCKRGCGFWRYEGLTEAIETKSQIVAFELAGGDRP